MKKSRCLQFIEAAVIFFGFPQAWKLGGLGSRSLKQSLEEICKPNLSYKEGDEGCDLERGKGEGI